MKKVYLHTLTIRIWHWVNALIVITLMLTGIQLRAPGVEELARTMGLWFPNYSLAVLLHKYAGFAMGASFLFWLVYIIASGGFRSHYLLRPADLPLLKRQAFYYIFGLFQGAENPFTPTERGKFNPLQKIAYGSVMLVLTPVVVFSGILFSDIFLFRDVIDQLGGVRMLDAIHVAVSYLFILNLIVHLYMCTMGHRLLDHVKAMIVGYEEMPDGTGPAHH